MSMRFGALRLLEAIRFLRRRADALLSGLDIRGFTGWCAKARRPRRRPFTRAAPYAVAKLYAYWITVNYREAYGLFACNGILFNHESPRRADLRHPQDHPWALQYRAGAGKLRLYMGNLDALRDWGHARDYVRMQWLMLNNATVPTTMSSPPASSIRSASS